MCPFVYTGQAKALYWMLQAEREMDVAQAIAEQRAGAWGGVWVHEPPRLKTVHSPVLFCPSAEAAAAAGAAASAASAAAAEGQGKGKGKGKGKKKAAVGAGPASSTVFFYEERVDPITGQKVYYK